MFTLLFKAVLTVSHCLKDCPFRLCLGHSSRDDCGEIQVTEADFQKALDALVPSVSLQELKRYKDLQNQFTMDNSHNTKK